MRGSGGSFEQTSYLHGSDYGWDKAFEEVIIALDNDEKGKRQATVVYQRLRERGLRTRIWHPTEKYKDVGEMPAEEVVAWMEHLRRHEEELDAILGPSMSVPGR